MRGDSGERDRTGAAPAREASFRGRVAVAAAAAFGFVACLRKINDPDYWTHLAFGRAFAAARSIFIPDPFLASAAGGGSGGPDAADVVRAFTGSSEWPFEIALYGVRAFLGDGAVSLLVAVAGALAIAALARPLLAETSAERLSIGVALIAAAAYAARFRFSPRPEAIAAVFLALALQLAYRWGEDPRWRVLAGIAGLLLVWMPIHVTWTLGVAWCGVAIALRPRIDFWRRQARAVRALAALGAAAAVAAAARFAWHVLHGIGGGGVFSAVTEMRPAWEFPSVLLPFGAVAAAGLALAWGGAEGRLVRLAVWGAAALLGVAVVRNVALASFAMVPGALRGLSQLPRRAPERRRAIAAVAVAASCCLAWLGAVARDRDYPMGVGVDWRHFPRRAAEYVRASGLEEPVFNSWGWGGYLDWAWNGRPRTFLDGRLADAATLADYGEVMSGDPGPILSRRGFRTAVIQPVFMNSGRLAPAADWFMSDPGWRLVQATDALVFARVPLPTGAAEVPLAGAWRVVLDEVQLASDQNDVAPHAPFTRAIALLQLGDPRGALAAYEEGERASAELAAQYEGLGPILRSRARE